MVTKLSVEEIERRKEIKEERRIYRNELKIKNEEKIKEERRKEKEIFLEKIRNEERKKKREEEKKEEEKKKIENKIAKDIKKKEKIEKKLENKKKVEEKKIQKVEYNSETLGNVIDNVLPWIDELIHEDGDMTEVKISDIRDMIGIWMNVDTLKSFANRFRLYMVEKGYYVRIKWQSDTVIISRSNKNLIENDTDKDAKIAKKLGELTKIMDGNSKEEYDYDVYKLVISKMEDIREKTGDIVTMKEVVDKAIKNGLNSVR